MSPSSVVSSSVGSTFLKVPSASSASMKRVHGLDPARLHGHAHGKGAVRLAARLDGGDPHVAGQRRLELGEAASSTKMPAGR